jgi:hypothetical protein
MNMRNALWLVPLFAACGGGGAPNSTPPDLAGSCPSANHLHYDFSNTQPGAPHDASAFDAALTALLPSNGSWQVQAFENLNTATARLTYVQLSGALRTGAVFPLTKALPAPPGQARLSYVETGASDDATGGSITIAGTCADQVHLVVQGATTTAGFTIDGDGWLPNFTVDGDRACSRDGAPPISCGAGTCPIGTWCNQGMCMCGDQPLQGGCACGTVDERHLGCGLISGCP